MPSRRKPQKRRQPFRPTWVRGEAWVADQHDADAQCLHPTPALPVQNAIARDQHAELTLDHCLEQRAVREAEPALETRPRTGP
jgi:hypothetical protein